MSKSAKVRKVFPTNCIVVLVDMMVEDGVAIASLLADTGIDQRYLHNPATRISSIQMLQVLRNACQHAVDPLTALRAGDRLNVVALGIYGYAMLSSPSHLHVTDIASRYGRLISEFASQHFSISGQVACWEVRPDVGVGPLDPLYRFVMEYKIAGMLSVARDLYGSTPFDPQRIELMYPRPKHANAYTKSWCKDIRFDCDSNRILFDVAIMSQPMAYANAITHALTRGICENNILQMQGEPVWADTVQTLLLERPGQFPGLESVADKLQINTRTLRRKLKLEETSFREILDEVRSNLAITYLRSTALSCEDIAVRVGFSDAANFRQAFLRWTGKSPVEYRLAQSDRQAATK